MNMFYSIAVERNKPAPKTFGMCNGLMEKWHLLFTTLKKGQWISGDIEHRKRVQCYASTFAKGRFKTYIHPHNPNKFVLVMVK